MWVAASTMTALILLYMLYQSLSSPSSVFASNMDESQSHVAGQTTRNNARGPMQPSASRLPAASVSAATGQDLELT
jgi:hypothetical protein